MPTPEDIARVRAEIRARQEERTRQRIVGIRAADRTMHVKEIAYRVGVPVRYAAEVLGERADQPMDFRLQ